MAIVKYSKIFDIVFISYGTEENLLRKINLLNDFVQQYNLDHIFFASCEIGKSNKREVLLDNIYLAIDNHSGHLEEMQSPKKILLKNFIDVEWNQTPTNDESTYVVNSFHDIDVMIEFDLKLKDMGIWLDT